MQAVLHPEKCISFTFMPFKNIESFRPLTCLSSSLHIWLWIFLLCLNCFFQTIFYVDMQYSVTHKLLNYRSSGILQIYYCYIVRSFCNIFITHPIFISSIICLLFLFNKVLIVHFIVSSATEVIRRRRYGGQEGGEVKNSDKEVHWDTSWGVIVWSSNFKLAKTIYVLQHLKNQPVTTIIVQHGF